MVTEYYSPVQVESQLAMHYTPRFGHTNEFAAVISEEGRDDYIDGIVAFAIFIFVLILVWLMILLILKVSFGVNRVGWAAGGDIVDVENMRKQQISRSRRKHRIRRNWRVQSTFLVASMWIPVLSFLLANHGLNPFIESLSDVEDVSNDIDTQAYLGIQTGQRIETIYRNLQDLVSFDVGSFCPNLPSSILNNVTHLTEIQKEISNTFNEVSPVVDVFIPGTIETLHAITKTTRKSEEIVDFILGHDWILNMILAAVNIINAFFLFGVFLTKNDIDYPVFQAFTSYLLIPVFCLLVIASVGTSCLFAAAATANADFCVGGNGVRSPIGTFKEILIRLGHSEGSQAFEALEYYSYGCHAEHPFAIFSDATKFLEASAASLESLVDTLNSMNQTNFQGECGGNFTFSNTTAVRISENIGLLKTNFDVALDLSSCPNLSPLFQFFSTGSICSDSINGLTILFSLTFAISVLSMIMLTTRAALFSPVIRAKRIKHREKEFEEYKSYMAMFYETDSWDMDPPKSFDDIVKVSSTVESDDDSLQSILTSSDDISIDTNQATMRESYYIEKKDEQIAVAKGSGHRDDRSVTSPSSSSFFAFRRKQFQEREVEVVYYSSDSDSDDDESFSVAMSLNSSISSLAAQIWKGSGVARSRSRKCRLETEGHTDEDSESGNISVSSNIRLFFKKTDRTRLERQEPNDCTASHSSSCAPRRERSNDPLNLGDFETNLDDDSSESARVELFHESPLSRNYPPNAPQKKVSAVARTTGARIK